MITKDMWEYWLGTRNEAYDYFMCLLVSIATVLLDILLSPLEIIAFIIWKIRER